MKKHSIIKVLTDLTKICICWTMIAILITCKPPKSHNNHGEKKVILYNGIELPEVWPPRYEVPKEAVAMPVPYLSNPPDIIPINVGRQLFVDDFLIEQSTLERTFHYPQYDRNNPILEPDQSWEETSSGALYAAPFSDGVWFDEKEEKFKMWYLTGGSKFYDQPEAFITAYAESEDGVNWIKPELDVVAGTNIVNQYQRDASTMWLDKLEENPEKRYKLFNVERVGREGWMMVLRYSPDGIQWSEGAAQSGEIKDRSTVFYNPFRKVWVFGTRINWPRVRSRAYLEHEDYELGTSLAHMIFEDRYDKYNLYWFGPWDDEVRNPDYPDIDPGIYNHDAIAYESLFLGFFNVWQGPENNVCKTEGIHKRNELLIGYSRDGFHWDRPDMHRFMGVSGTNDQWNDGNIQSVIGSPLIVGDSLYFYCSGRKTNSIFWDSNMSTGLAKLRRDGFASLNAGSLEGFVTTRNLTFNGEYLFVNADASNGQLRAEILDVQGNVISSYSKDECKPVKTNGTKIKINWNNHDSLEGLPETIRIKFYLTDAAIYSFWVSEGATGESGGYTGGGGPGLHESGKDLPLSE